MTTKQKRLMLCTVLFCPMLVLVFCWSLLSPLVLLSLFFTASFCAFLALAFLLVPIRAQLAPSRTRDSVAQPPMLGDTLPSVPRTLAEVHLMGPTQFEVFSAAVLVAMGEGYRFLRHCGKSGDQGIDVTLLNLYHNPVAVQCKLYASDNHVGQPELRDFLGSILWHQAVYGFFVTTSTFTPAALRFITGTNGRIRPIDGRQLEVLLQYRTREIALALHDIRVVLSGIPS